MREEAEKKPRKELVELNEKLGIIMKNKDLHETTDEDLS